MDIRSIIAEVARKKGSLGWTIADLRQCIHEHAYDLFLSYINTEIAKKQLDGERCVIITVDTYLEAFQHLDWARWIPELHSVMLNITPKLPETCKVRTFPTGLNAANELEHWYSILWD